MSRLTQSEYQTLADFYGHNLREWEQFFKCQAWVSERIYNSAYNVDFRLVKSYNTIVGVIDYTNQKYIRLGKWSTTTSKQQTRISRVYARDFKNIQF